MPSFTFTTITYGNTVFSECFLGDPKVLDIKIREKAVDILARNSVVSSRPKKRSKVLLIEYLLLLS
jgi:hypothetical protein